MRHEKGCPKNVTQHQKGLEHGTFGSPKKLSIEESNEVPKIQEATMTHKAQKTHKTHETQETQKV